MKIALISKLWETTDPSSTGGTGMSVGLLADELVSRGHKVTLFATGNSKTKAKLVSIRHKKWDSDYSEPLEYLNIAQAFSDHKKFDIIHTHVEQKAAMFADLVDKTPVLMSIRYGEFLKDELTILKTYKNLNWLANSKVITKILPFIKFKDVVYNGLDMSRYKTGLDKGYLLFLARLSPQKGPHIAIAAAKKLGMKLIIAGKIVDTDKKYLEEQILKHVDGKQIKYVGEVGFKEKIKLLSGATALLHPNSIAEACSNVILEAQACGVPVIAYNNGSNKELIVNKKTGFIVKNLNGIISAINKIDTINRDGCRQHIEKNFSLQKMADNYEKIYKKYVRK
jgi:glycosyltransferase involved in cell wall biosynthesis